MISHSDNFIPDPLLIIGATPLYLMHGWMQRVFSLHAKTI